MDVIVPQYIVTPDSVLSGTSGYGDLLQSNIGADPSTDIYSATAEYTTGDTVYFVSTVGPTKGCWVSYTALQDMLDNTGSGGEDDRGKDPETETAYWSPNGAIESYKMFDQYSSTLSTISAGGGNIDFYIFCKAATTIAFLRVQAKSIRIEGWNCTTVAATSTAAKPIDITINLNDPLYDMYEYFYTDISIVRDIIKPINLELYHNLVLKITIVPYSSSVDVSIGNCIVGRSYNIGKLQYGVESGIEDYSTKEFDDSFGSHFIVERAYRKLLDCDLIVPVNIKNTVNSILTQIRAKPTIFNGNTEGTSFDDLLIYGIVSDFSIVHETPTFAECSLEIEGII